MGDAEGEDGDDALAEMRAALLEAMREKLRELGHKGLMELCKASWVVGSRSRYLVIGI